MYGQVQNTNGKNNKSNTQKNTENGKKKTPTKIPLCCYASLECNFIDASAVIISFMLAKPIFDFDHYQCSNINQLWAQRKHTFGLTIVIIRAIEIGVSGAMQSKMNMVGKHFSTSNKLHGHITWYSNMQHINSCVKCYDYTKWYKNNVKRFVRMACLRLSYGTRL